MAQELTVQIPLARNRTGLTLRAQLYNTAGATVGGLVSTGFTEFALGHYQWNYAAYPDGFEGSVVFTISGAPTVPVASIALNDGDFGVTSAASAAAIAAAVWSFATRTLTVALALTPADLLAIAQAVWAWVPRTLTMSFAAISAAIAGTSITQRRGDTWEISLTGLGNISTRTKLWFTLKESENDSDAQSIIQITEAGGMLYLNGAPAISAQGSLTVTNAVTGAVTIDVVADATDELELASNLYWDIQWASGAFVETLREGKFVVIRDASRAVS